MADAIPPLLIEIQLQTQQMQKQLDDIQGKVKGFGETVKKEGASLEGFKRKIEGAFALAGVSIGLGELVAKLKESTKMAAEDAQGKAELARQLKATAGASDVLIESVNKQMEALETTTAISVDQLRPAYERLLRTTGDTAKSMNLLTLATDISVGAHTSLTAAAKGLAMAQTGNWGLLNRLIPGIKDATDKWGFLEKAMGGAAKTAADSNPYLRIKILFEQIQKTIGAELLPVVQGFADWLGKLRPKIQEFFKELSDPTTTVGKRFKEFTDGVKDSMKWVIKNADALKNWAIAIGLVVGAVKAYEFGIKAAAAAQALFNIALDANPIFIAISAIALLVLGLEALKGALDNIGAKDMANKANVAANAAGQRAYDAYMATAKREQTSTGPGQVLQSERVAAEKARADAFAKAMQPAVSKIKDNLNGSVRSVSTDLGGSSGTGGSGGSGGGSGASTISAAAKARAAADKKFVAVLKQTQKDITAANDDYQKAVQAANEKYGTLIKQYAAEMQGIIQQSMDRLRDAFKSAVAVDVGSIFKDLVTAGKATSDDLLASLKSRLEAAKTLADNAAALSGAGFSQTFIEQVVAQGPDLGNQLAQTLKDATPESQKEIQDLFGKSEVLANTGMDELARTIYTKSGLATDELKKLYDAANANMLQAQKDLSAALVAAATALNDSMTAIQKKFDDTLQAMADSAAKHSKTIASLMGQIAAGKTTAVAAGAVVSSGSGPGESAAASFGPNTPWAQAQANYMITNNVQTNASPTLIADTTVAAIKYGMPLSQLFA